MNLKTPVTKLPFVGRAYALRLKKLGISTIEDLLWHVPARYVDYSHTSQIFRVGAGETVTIQGQIIFIKNQYTKSGKKIQIAEVSDGTQKINVIWFNQPYLVRSLAMGTFISLSGKVGWWNKKIALISPEYERIIPGKEQIHTGRLLPIYHETSGLSSKWLRSRIAQVFPIIENKLCEYLPLQVLSKYNLPDLQTSLREVHFPQSFEAAENARKRLAFDELLFLHLTSLHRRLDWNKNQPSQILKVDKKLVKEFIGSLPFELTSSQEKSVEEILSDLSKNTPMNRLLEGDVGSGKTVVAAIATFVTFTNGFQTVFMAPTQILATQHFNTLKNLFADFKVRLSLVTSGTTQGDIGKTDVFVGTHALIHKKVNFDNVGLVVIDEQHRFGVEQRAHLIRKSGKKSFAPHVLTMTATPIPRTVTLTVYGDLDLSTLTELPKGRQKITTWIVPRQKREKAYEWVSQKIIKDKIQVFVICPLIEESEVESMKQVKAATKEFANLKKVFKNFKLGLLHGRQKTKLKNETIKKFREGKIDILVSTPVVEVGMDIPNAAIMIIEAADRFGLASLHQLRGRIGRGEKKSYCLLFTQGRSTKSKERLAALTKTLSGFELAELDLKLRGPGEIFGYKQHGFPELKIANWSDFELIQKTKKVAEAIIKNPNKYSKVFKILQKKLVTN